MLTGADMQPELNGKPVSMFCPIAAGAGDVLTLGMAVQGLRGYLAVQGGIQVPVVMGSRSTNLKCGIGGLEGRALRDGDVLATASGGLNFADSVSGNRLERKKEISRRAARARQLLIGPEGEYLRRPSNPYRIMNQERVVMVRAVPGPQSEAFTESGKRVFERNFYRLTADSNRMACKLTGAAVETAAGSDMISDGIVEGSVQIASDGMPIVMLADHQTTGGYAKIGTVISTDIPALAQLKPGEQIAFKFVTPKEAVAVCRREARKLAWIKKYLEG